MAATLIGFTGMETPALSSESLALPALWETSAAVRSGAGYKDNVFLSSTQPQGSGFASVGADFFALRLAPIGPQFTFFAGADANFYWATIPQQNEYTVFAQAQLEQDLGGPFTGWLALDYFYQDQIQDVAFFDPTLSVTNAQSTVVRGHTATIRPGVSTDLSSQFSLALELPATRQFYEEPLDDNWNVGLRLTLGHSYGHTSQLSLGYEPAWRGYSTQPALDANGAAIPNTQLQQLRQDVGLSWRHHWDEQKRWRTVTRVGGRLVQENGSGFSNYGQVSASAEIRYRSRRWEVSAEASALTYQYANQPVSATDPSKLRRSEWSAAVRLERELTRNLRVVASYEHGQTLSNNSLDSYTVNTFSGSLVWEF